MGTKLKQIDTCGN